jgi:hypothetical protein
LKVEGLGVCELALRFRGSGIKKGLEFLFSWLFPVFLSSSLAVPDAEHPGAEHPGAVAVKREY